MEAATMAKRLGPSAGENRAHGVAELAAPRSRNPALRDEKGGLRAVGAVQVRQLELELGQWRRGQVALYERCRCLRKAVSCAKPVRGRLGGREITHRARQQRHDSSEKGHRADDASEYERGEDQREVGGIEKAEDHTPILPSCARAVNERQSGTPEAGPQAQLDRGAFGG